MKSIEQFPGDEMELRQRLPEFKEKTRDALIRWGEVQPGALPWLLKRSAKYWEHLSIAQRQHAADGWSLACDATAALDLLRWRIEAKDDRAAVQHLTAPEFTSPRPSPHAAHAERERKPEPCPLTPVS